MDAGSTYTAVPQEMLQRLGVPVERSLHSETADGRLVPVDVGRTTIRLEGLEFSTPVIFAEMGEPSLLGMVSLEEAALAVDPPGRTSDTGKPAAPLTTAPKVPRPWYQAAVKRQMSPAAHEAGERPEFIGILHKKGECVTKLPEQFFGPLTDEAGARGVGQHQGEGQRVQC